MVIQQIYPNASPEQVAEKLIAIENGVTQAKALN